MIYFFLENIISLVKFRLVGVLTEAISTDIPGVQYNQII